jgi:TonB-dependent SusC/RagA subfamily outer membrane receptor
LQTSGEPGADAANIFIRGKSSWVDSSPLVLVDGVERNFNDINPNEIESLSVLKDASATAVFGIKGANGVILITTKRGREGRTQLTYSSELTMKQPLLRRNMFNSYETALLVNEAHRNDDNWHLLFPMKSWNITGYRMNHTCIPIPTGLSIWSRILAGATDTTSI